MQMLILFTVLSIVNVVFSTIRSLVTIKSGKWVASLVNAGYFAYYTIVLIYTVADFPLWQKVLVTFGCNLVGVFIVKLIEEKKQKETLWRIEATVKKEHITKVSSFLKANKISYSLMPINSNENTVYIIYSPDCATSERVKEIITECQAKYFVTEMNKNL